MKIGKLNINVDFTWLSKKYPLKTQKGYAWQCAYTDALDKHYMLPSYIWDNLYGYSIKDGSSLYKIYKQKKYAIQVCAKIVSDCLYKEMITKK